MENLTQGRKFDAEKPRYDLMPFNALDEVAHVLAFGAAKYGENNWRRVPRARSRYISAALRHISSYQQGREMDEETARHALAHAICSLLFVVALDVSGEADEENLGDLLKEKISQMGEAVPFANAAPFKCDHAWIQTGAMEADQCRCVKCGQWGAT